MLENKKICFFVRNFPVLSQTFVLNQVKDFIEEGLEVQVISVNPITDEENVSSELVQNVSSILPAEHGTKSYFYMLMGLIFCLFSFRRYKLISLFFHFLKKNNKFLAKDLMCSTWFLRKKNIQVDKCIAHFGSNGVVMEHFISAGLVKCNKLYTVFHGFEISRYDQLDLWKSYYGKLSGTLLPISEHWKNKLIELGASPDCIEVVHMGVDVTRFSYKNKPFSTPLAILSVARATEKKGLIYAIEAVLKCKIDCRYKIIGDGALLASLKEVAANHENGYRIVFDGAKSSDYVAHSLKNSDLFLLPSVRDSAGDMEGIPVSLMEAMASGVIVLSTIHSGIPELIEDGYSGFLVPEKDTLALSNKILSISKNENLSRIRINAREKVEKEFNSVKLRNDLMQLISR